MSAHFAYVAISATNVRKVEEGQQDRLCIADVQCVDEHGHRLEMLRDVLCCRTGFVRYLENHFEEPKPELEQYAARCPEYDVYNEEEFARLLCM